MNMNSDIQDSDSVFESNRDQGQLVHASYFWRTCSYGVLAGLHFLGLGGRGASSASAGAGYPNTTGLFSIVTVR